MPAETHQHRDPFDAEAVLDLLAAVLGVCADDAADSTLRELDLDDPLGVARLWECVVEEFGERAVGDADPTDTDATTLGELAAEFYAALQPSRTGHEGLARST